MKKKLIIIFATIMASAGIASAKAHEYTFTLKCGQTVHMTFDHSLSDLEILEWTKHFEELRCGTNDGPIELITD